MGHSSHAFRRQDEKPPGRGASSGGHRGRRMGGLLDGTRITHGVRSSGPVPRSCRQGNTRRILRRFDARTADSGDPHVVRPVPESWVVRLSYAVLVLLAVVGYGAISFSGGFSVTGTFLLGLLGVCGTAGLAFVGTNALRRELSKDAFPEGVRFLSPAIATSVFIPGVMVLAVALILFARSIDSGDTAILKCSTPNDSRTFTPVCP